MSKVKSIKCTNCAAPLDLLGGGRVESITCAYCKSVLDLNDNYKVLSNFKNIKELHKLPFEIGMKGKLKGIEYTIIGRVTYRDIAYPHGEWTDFLLFSALYGYAYLTYEEGHLIYSKRNRTFPNVEWAKLTQHSSISVDSKSYEAFDAYEAKVSYVEGELTWIAKRDDKTSFVDFIAPPFGISAEKTKNEIEYYQAEYLQDADVYEAFNIEKEETPTNFHALQPFERPFLKSLSSIAYWVLLIVALLFVLVKVDGRGKPLVNTTVDNTKVHTLPFKMHTTKYLLNLELKASKAKELNNFNLKILKDSELYVTLNKSTVYNVKKKKRLEPWEKNAKKVSVYLNLEETGIYNLVISPVESNLSSKLSISIQEARSRVNYLAWFFALTLFFWSFYKFVAWRYQRTLDNERGIYSNDEDISFIGSHLYGNSLLWYIVAVIIFIVLDILG